MLLTGVDGSLLVGAEDDEDHGSMLVEVMDLLHSFKKLINWEGLQVSCVSISIFSVVQSIGEVEDGGAQGTC
jgi:hypothetical protein